MEINRTLASGYKAAYLLKYDPLQSRLLPKKLILKRLENTQVEQILRGTLN